MNYTKEQIENILPDADIVEKRLISDLLAWREIAEKQAKALVYMRETHGMHGPCKYNSCTECTDADKAAAAAMRAFEEASK